MSLQTRLEALSAAVGVDVKSILSRIENSLLPPTRDLPALNGKVTAITIVDDGSATGSWPNRWEWLYRPVGDAAGTLTSWFNEYGELRVTPAKSNTVAFRIFGKSSSTGPARTQNVFEIQDARDTRNVMLGMGADGSMITAGSVTRQVPGGPTLSTGYLRLTAGAAIPANTPAGTLIIRTP